MSCGLHNTRAILKKLSFCRKLVNVMVGNTTRAQTVFTSIYNYVALQSAYRMELRQSLAQAQQKSPQLAASLCHIEQLLTSFANLVLTSQLHQRCPSKLARYLPINRSYNLDKVMRRKLPTHLWRLTGALY